jgi:hypothetical protein
MRQPPAAGPRAVEWIGDNRLQTGFFVEEAWTPSCPSKSGESNKVMLPVSPQPE